MTPESPAALEQALEMGARPRHLREHSNFYLAICGGPEGRMGAAGKESDTATAHALTGVTPP